MESIRKQNSDLYRLLDRFATDQHNNLLKRIFDQLASYIEGTPSLHVLPAAQQRLRDLAETTVDLEMRGKTIEPIDFSGYTLCVPLKSDLPFDSLYITRPFTNKLKLTVFPKMPPLSPFALWIKLAPQQQELESAGFNPQSVINVHRGPAPRLPLFIKSPNELISATVLLRESLETSPFNPEAESNLRQAIPAPLEAEVGRRFFPPLQVIRSRGDDILRAQSYLLRLPIVPLIITHAAGYNRSLIQLETVPSWPDQWSPEVAFAKTTDQVLIIGQGLNYDLPTLLSLMVDITKATTAAEDYPWPF